MELQLNINERYSFADYLLWIDDKRRELINGFIKMMSPAPLSEHQKISFNISGEFYLFHKKNKTNCAFFEAPFDVRLPTNGEKEDNKIFTVVQPDIVIICDKNKLDKRGCLGAPDFIIEIISKSTAKKDMEDKYNLYEQHGVKEYWIVFPHEEVIQKFVLESNTYIKKGTFAKEDKIPVHIFKDKLKIDLKDVFTEN